MNQILEDTLSLREYDMKLNSIRVHREFDPNLPSIGGDCHQLQQVFLNILNNAVDAVTEKRGNGRNLAAHRCRRTTSCGWSSPTMGPEFKILHRVFDPFYTTKAGRQGNRPRPQHLLRHRQGTRRRNSGSQHATSGGAIFSITLPLAAVRRRAEAGKARRVRGASRASGKVLLVDDDDAVLQLEQEILVARGISVKTARSARKQSTC